MPIPATARKRAQAFSDRFGLRAPILLAPMAGSSPPALAAAVANSGGMGGFGALMSNPDAMRDWAAQFRSRSNGSWRRAVASAPQEFRHCRRTNASAGPVCTCVMTCAVSAS